VIKGACEYMSLGISRIQRVAVLVNACIICMSMCKDMYVGMKCEYVCYVVYI
jgi:hypothetical protein